MAGLAALPHYLPPASEQAVFGHPTEASVEEEMATHASIPFWRIPWTEELSGLQFMRVAKSQMLSD